MAKASSTPAGVESDQALDASNLPGELLVFGEPAAEKWAALTSTVRLAQEKFGAGRRRVRPEPSVDSEEEQQRQRTAFSPARPGDRGQVGRQRYGRVDHLPAHADRKSGPVGGNGVGYARGGQYGDAGKG
jgi:hypothetical protein